jgi:hypothetical protein
MKSLFHFEKFARLAALSRRVSLHRKIPSFTRLMLNATTLQHLSTTLLVDTLTTPRRASPSFAQIQFP